MQRIDGPTRSAVLTAPSATGTGTSSPGYFSDGDPLSGTPATTVPADWFNMMQEEISCVIEHSGAVLDKGNRGQLLAALLATFTVQGAGSGVTMSGSEITIPLPGGFYLKIGQVAIGGGSNIVNGQVAFAAPFANACFYMGGNADGAANANWHPIVIMIAPPNAQGAAFIADSANVGQAISAGRTLRWIAIGN